MNIRACEVNEFLLFPPLFQGNKLEGNTQLKVTLSIQEGPVGIQSQFSLNEQQAGG